jgi:hypothetical protein
LGVQIGDIKLILCAFLNNGAYLSSKLSINLIIYT